MYAIQSEFGDVEQNYSPYYLSVAILSLLLNLTQALTAMDGLPDEDMLYLSPEDLQAFLNR